MREIAFNGNVYNLFIYGLICIEDIFSIHEDLKAMKQTSQKFWSKIVAPCFLQQSLPTPPKTML